MPGVRCARHANPIDRIDQSISAHAELPEAIQFFAEGLAGGGICGDGPQGRPDLSLQLWGQMANDLGHVGRDLDPPRPHYRVRGFAGTNRSPNTSSSDSPCRPRA